jgi:hypothetical protein
LDKFSENYVKEKQQNWSGRAGFVGSVKFGATKDNILKYMGKPDPTSDSDTRRNWFNCFGAA